MNTPHQNHIVLVLWHTVIQQAMQNQLRILSWNRHNHGSIAVSIRPSLSDIRGDQIGSGAHLVLQPLTSTYCLLCSANVCGVLCLLLCSQGLSDMIAPGATTEAVHLTSHHRHHVITAYKQSNGKGPLKGPVTQILPSTVANAAPTPYNIKWRSRCVRQCNPHVFEGRPTGQL